MGLGLPEVGVKAVVQNLPGFQAAMRSINASMRDATHGIHGMASASSVGQKALSALASVGIAAVTAAAAIAVAAISALVAAIAKIGFESVKVAISVEAAFAGVTKTTDGLVDEFGNLTEAGEKVKQEFRDLALAVPMDLEGLMKVGELAGQLNVAQDQLAGFTEVMVGLAVSTNLTAEQAANSIARIQSIYQIATDDMSHNAAQFGSAIVELGNNFATTEAEILDFTMRIAGAGTVAGMSQADILGIGTAMTSVGIQAELGGTAVQKVILNIQDAVSTGSEKLAIFAQMAGMSAAEFKKAWETDAAGAFTAFVNGLGASGDDAINVLEQLDLQDQRLIRAFLTLAASGDLLSDAMEMSNDAFMENTALSTEANKRYQTMASQLKILKNRFRDAALTIGDALLPALGDIIIALTPVIEAIGNELPRIMEALSPIIENVVGNIVSFFERLGERIPGIVDTIVGLLSGDIQIGEFIPQSVLNAVSSFQDMLDRLGAWWAENGPGIRETAGNLFARLSETIGKLIDNVMPFLSEQFEKFADWFDENGPLIQAFIADMADRFAKFADAVATAWSFIEPLLSGLFSILLDLATLIMQIATGDWAGAWKTIKSIAVTAAKAIWEAIVNFLDWIASLFGSSLAEIGATWSENWEMFKEIVSYVWEVIVSTVQGYLQAISDFISNVFTGVSVMVSFVWNYILSIIQSILATIAAVISSVLTSVATWWSEKWETIKHIANMVLSAISVAVTAFFEWIANLFGTSLEEISALWTTIWSAIQGFFMGILNTLLEAIGSFLATAIAWWEEKWTAIREFVSETWDKIVETVRTMVQKVLTTIVEKIEEIIAKLKAKVTDFINIGKEIIQGIINGILAMASKLVGTIIDVVKSAVTAAQDALQMQSPSKVFFEIGVGITEGWEEGIKANANAVIGEIDALSAAVISAPQAQLAMGGMVPMLAPTPSPIVHVDGGTSNSRTFSPTINTITQPQSPVRIIDDIMLLSMLEGAGA